MLREGIMIGERYEILGRIGTGGMADVYKGKDHKLNRFVAVKVLKKDYRSDKTFIQKFVSEAQAAGGLMHPNVVNVYDVGQDRGLYYIVMELVEGINLKDYIEKKGQLSVKETISISIQMVTGIQAAHSHHIIHRDIKPQNIIISKDGKVKVTDFGIARATTSTQTISTNVMGSVHYTSPEQARGGIVDEKSDIYSAGITMYEMITGHVPFDGDSTVSVAIKHLQEEIPSPAEDVPNIPYSLECIILKCTQKNPALRYQSCQELLADLKRSLVDPDGDFVNNSRYTSGGTETVVMSDEELRRIQGRNYNYSRDDDDYDYDPDDDDDYDRDDDDDDYDGRRSRRSKNEIDPSAKNIMRILMIVAAVIIAFVLLFMIGRAAGIFKSVSSPIKSESTEQTEVPDVVGKTEADAKAALHDKNLGYVVKARKASDKYAEGVVMEQEVAAGTKVDKNSEIKVVVSTGKEIKKVQMPDVVGKDEAAAQKALEDKNLVVESEAKYDDEVEAGKVISTDPAAGIEIDEGTKVKMYVSLGADKIPVPSIVGMYQADAENALKSVELEVGEVTEVYSDEYEAGVVVSQKKAADSKVEKGTAIDFEVSKGPKIKMVEVPSLNGKTFNDAAAALEGSGLNVGTVTYEYSSGTMANYVMYQSAEAGSQVEEGTYIDFVVSKGPEPTVTPQPGPGEGDDVTLEGNNRSSQNN